MSRVLLLSLTAICAFAQGPTDPPPIVELVRKPGMGLGPIRPYGDARAAIDVVGMTSVTGLPETWLLESHYSYASVEETDRALDNAGAFHGPSQGSAGQDDVFAPAHTMLLRYQPELSYRPDQAIRVFPRARYFHVTIYRVRGASETDFARLVTLRRANLDSMNADLPDIAYDVVSGAPAGTYVFFAPVVTLRSMDEGLPNRPVYAERLAEERAKAKATTSPADIERENLLLRVDPRLSFVSDAWASVDRDFWRR
jgi:hypothetical protein